MATDRRGGMSVDQDTGAAQRAGWFLAEQGFPGPHKDKRIASAFGISPSMAKKLRHGSGWTLARIDQALKAFGPTFQFFVFGNDSHELTQRMARIEKTLEAVAASLARGAFDPGLPAVGADGAGAADDEHSSVVHDEPRRHPETAPRHARPDLSETIDQDKRRA